MISWGLSCQFLTSSSIASIPQSLHLRVVRWFREDSCQFLSPSMRDCVLLIDHISLWFWFAFPLWLTVLMIMCLFCHPYIFGEVFIQIFSMSCKSFSPYSLDSSPLSNRWFAYMFSESLACLCILWICLSNSKSF